MPRFAPITTAAHLPAADSAYERSTLDFKATSSPKPTFEQAKDVAAFANRFGGTILIGFEERGDGRVGVLKPLTESYAAGVKNAVSNAVRDRCRPSPTVDIDVIAVGEDQRVLAVNVSPFFGQPVGVVANDATKGECAYVFPFRTLTDTRYLRPEELPMFFEPRYRRTVVLLAAIPSCPTPSWQLPRCRVLFKNPSNGGTDGLQMISVADFTVDEDRNNLACQCYPSQSDAKTFTARIPLEDIESVGQRTDTEWCIVVRGWLQTNTKMYIPIPSNARFKV